MIQYALSSLDQMIFCIIESNFRIVIDVEQL